MLRIVYQNVDGYQATQPSAIDTTTSPDFVYLRKNITAVPNTDTEGTHWNYDEARLTLAQYELYLSELENPAQKEIMQKQNEIELLIYQLMAQLVAITTTGSEV